MSKKDAGKERQAALAAARVLVASMKGKEVTKIKDAEQIALLLVIGQMLGLVDETGKIL